MWYDDPMIKYLLPFLLLMTNLQATQTQVVILLGPPGAGKGSQAAFLKETLHVPHISTGDLLRNHIKNQTELGKKAKSYIDAGKLGPDELIFSMLFERVAAPDCEKGYILDGFPRNLEQAKTFQKQLNDEVSVVAINLAVPDSILIDRIVNRQICQECQAPYHLTFSPPKVKGVCDVCKGTLYHRSDDTKEIVQNRLKVYHEQTAPLIDYYANQGKLHMIDGNKPKEQVVAQLTQLLHRPVQQDKIGAGNVN